MQAGRDNGSRQEPIVEPVAKLLGRPVLSQAEQDRLPRGLAHLGVELAAGQSSLSASQGVVAATEVCQVSVEGLPIPALAFATDGAAMAAQGATDGGQALMLLELGLNRPTFGIRKM
jgi:hypothetical protein